MSDRGRGRGRGNLQSPSFPNRGRGDGGRGSYGGDRGGRGGARGGGRGGPPPASFRQNGKINTASQNVHNIEEQSFTGGVTADLQRLSIKDMTTAPARPGYGTKGRKVNLWANYFELLPNKSAPFNRYNVAFIPVDKKMEEPKGKKLERLVQLLLPEFPTTIPLATDYRSTILTTTTLGFTRKEYSIAYYSETENSPGNKAPKYIARVQFTGTLTFETLVNYLSSTNLTDEKPAIKDEIIQATNILLAHGMKSDNKLIAKKNKYFPAHGHSLMDDWMLKNGLEAFRGFFMSVRAATGRILLNVQVQHVVAWVEQPLTKLLDKLKSEEVKVDEMSRMLSGVYVKVNHLNNRLRRITGFANPKDGYGIKNPPKVKAFGADANNVSFYRDTPSPARYVSVAEHFKQTYGALSRPSYPVINVGTRKAPIYMPAENCSLKAHQPYDKKLTPEATAAMIKFAVRQAPENARTIIGNGMSLLGQNSEKTLGRFGIKVDPSMLTVRGRVLNGFDLLYAGSGGATPTDGSWNMRSIKFKRCASISEWSYLWINDKRDKRGNLQSLPQVAQCVTKLTTILRACGVQATEPRPGQELELKNPQDPGPQIESFFARAAQHNIKLLLVILPNNSSTIYNAVKRAGDIVHGIHTIGVQADGRKFAKALETDNAQYFANVALKFNLKFGGQNQALKPADLGFINDGKTMLVGLDVTHPAPGSAENAPSVSSITASTSGDLSQWPADVKIQTGRKEMIEGLKEMFKSRLHLWQLHNQQRLPEEILIYRDGVGETMYDLVRTEELPLIRQACQEVYPATATKANKPYITIVICGKRHHTRFYPTTEAEADSRGNCKPGTVVDRGITETRIWDFYLQAHSALQGTAKPCHYIVVHDEIFRRRAAAATIKDGRTVGQRAQDDLEGLTHAMCYMFGRATKAVSLCPPAYYADLVCDRARRWLSRVFDERTVVSSEGGEAKPEDVQIHAKLKNTMFYI